MDRQRPRRYRLDSNQTETVTDSTELPARSKFIREASSSPNRCFLARHRGGFVRGVELFSVSDVTGLNEVRWLRVPGFTVSLGVLMLLSCLGKRTFNEASEVVLWTYLWTGEKMIIYMLRFYRNGWLTATSASPTLILNFILFSNEKRELSFLISSNFNGRRLLSKTRKAVPSCVSDFF